MESSTTLEPETLALAGGFEPPTHCLQGSCSTPELRQHRQNFTLGASHGLVKVFLTLAEDLVAYHSRRGGHVQRSHPTRHRNGEQTVARPRHEGSEALPLRTEDQAHWPGQGHLP